jgi:hypothetical protein
VKRSTLMTPPPNRNAAPTTSEKTIATPIIGIPQRGDLPTWESFPLPERRLLVSALVQTAHRQIQNQLPIRPVTARG